MTLQLQILKKVRLFFNSVHFRGLFFRFPAFFLGPIRTTAFFRFSAFFRVGLLPQNSLILEVWESVFSDFWPKVTFFEKYWSWGFFTQKNPNGGGKRWTFWTFSVYMTPKKIFEKKCIFWTFWTFRHLFYEKFRDKSSNFELFMSIARGQKFLTKKCIFEHFELLGTFFIRKSSKSSNFELFELLGSTENFRWKFDVSPPP